MSHACKPILVGVASPVLFLLSLQSFLVTTSPSHPHQPVRRYQMDSGFAENHGSSDNLLFSSSSPFSNIITNFTLSDDEVFITPIYSDTSSSTHAHYSIETSNVSSNSSIVDRSNDDNNDDDDEETISNQSLNSLADFPRCSTPVIAHLLDTMTPQLGANWERPRL